MEALGYILVTFQEMKLILLSFQETRSSLVVLEDPRPSGLKLYACAVVTRVVPQYHVED